MTKIFLTRKPTVTELNFEINRIQLCIALLGNGTYLLFLCDFFRCTVCLGDNNLKKIYAMVEHNKKKYYVGITDQITTISTVALKSLF